LIRCNRRDLISSNSEFHIKKDDLAEDINQTTSATLSHQGEEDEPTNNTDESTNNLDESTNNTDDQVV